MVTVGTLSRITDNTIHFWRYSDLPVDDHEAVNSRQPIRKWHIATVMRIRVCFSACFVRHLLATNTELRLAATETRSHSETYRILPKIDNTYANSMSWNIIPLPVYLKLILAPYNLHILILLQLCERVIFVSCVKCSLMSCFLSEHQSARLTNDTVPSRV